MLNKKSISKSFELVLEDIINWFRAIIIFLAPTIIMSLEKIGSWESMLDNNLLKWMAISAAIDLLRRFIINNNQNDQVWQGSTNSEQAQVI